MYIVKDRYSLKKRVRFYIIGKENIILKLNWGKERYGTVHQYWYQGFESIREENSFYIDKSDFIREWWESADVMTLITRPRRFGKTLNMSMVNCFFSNQYAGRSALFEGLSVWKEEKYRKLQGTYPVIF